jgi:hypothetical protein
MTTPKKNRNPMMGHYRVLEILFFVLMDFIYCMFYFFMINLEMMQRSGEMMQRCAQRSFLISCQLAMVYNLRGAPESVRGLGSELHGQEDAGKKWAEFVDQRYRLKAEDLTAEENNKIPVCMDGIGVGKTALLMNGLALLKNHCQDPDLRGLMQDESHPLVIHLTFNGMTTFDPFREHNPESALIRRVLKVCLGLDWQSEPPLSHRLTLADCLDAIIEYHKSSCGMEADQKLFVYLGLDDVNKLTVNDDPAFLRELSTL